MNSGDGTLADNESTSAHPSSVDARARRDPPTIDLDSSDVSGDTNASWGQAAGRYAGRAKSWFKSGAWLIAPAITGALAAIAVSGGAWLAGPSRDVAPPPPPPTAMTLSPDLAARFARLESRLDNLPPPAAAKAPLDPEFAARVSAAEQSLQVLRDNIASMRRQLEALTTALAELKSAPRDPSAPAEPTATPDDGPLKARIGELGQAVAALKDDLAGHQAAPASERPLRRVVVATLLESAVRSGQGFAAQLASAKGLADDPALLAPLEAFAAAGLPSDAAKCRELLTLIPRLRPTPEAPPPSTGLGDRIWANASRLVRIRPAGDSDAGDVASLVARIEAAAQRNDLADAMRAIARLPEPQASIASSFANGVKARDAALAISRQFAADGLAALANSGASKSAPSKSAP